VLGSSAGGDDRIIEFPNSNITGSLLVGYITVLPQVQGIFMFKCNKRMPMHGCESAVLVDW
jgi:hypothetical protein